MRTRVIVSGLLRDGLGLAEMARGYADALDAAGYEVAQHVVRLPGRGIVGDPGPTGVLPFPEVDSTAEADVVLVCLNPPEVDALRGHRLRLPRGRVNIASWAWEVAPLPESWGARTARLDEVWVPSDYVATIVRPHLSVPVAALPLAIRLPPTEDRLATQAAPNRFLALADAASGLSRKNLTGAVEAFRRAFAPGAGPVLVVKVWNGEVDPEGMAALRAAVGDRPDIEILDRWLDRRAFARLLRSTACLVSLHRAEGFGLPLFEALAAGVPVVATAYSAPTEWLDDTTAFLVSATPSTVPENAHPYPAGASWADPDLDDAARQLRAVWDDPAAAHACAARGQALVESSFTAPAVGRRLASRLEPLLATHATRPARSAIRPEVQVIVAAAEPWPALAGFLESVGPEIVRVGGELVVGAHDGRVLPVDHRPEWTQSHAAASTDPFELRAAALRAADAELVVVTEDHCVPEPGWLTSFVRAAAATDGAVLAGSVTNGSTSTRADWANYLLGFAAYAPPLLDVPTDRCPTVANCAVPGHVLVDAAAGSITAGWFERDLVAELWRTGGTELVPGATVAHTQAFPAWHHLRNHFDDARCAGAHAAVRDADFRPSFTPSALLDVTRTFLRGVVVAVAAREDLIAPHRRAQVWLRALAGVRAIGLAAGARFGAGRSGDRLD